MMSSKIFRDPLYNYISLNLDKDRDRWLVKLLDCPELQRLRRIHQLGVSYLTYPGADHNRLSHSLGVLHLTMQALDHLERISNDPQVRQGREPVLAAALLHDVGHGAFSHVFEPCLNTKHEHWSIKVVLSEETEVNKILKSISKSTPETVAELIDGENHEHPAWMKYLLSSQLDADRLDYLRRDSLFTGAGYGHFDWFRILNTCEFHEEDAIRTIVWPEKSKLAIEEYIFARYYMFQNVYHHKTTRGFEKIIGSMWSYAKTQYSEGIDVDLLDPIQRIFSTDDISVKEYLAIEEFTVMYQIHKWRDNRNHKVLADLARRFLDRDRLVAIDAPDIPPQLALGAYEEWESELCRLVSESGYEAPDSYCLKDQVKGKYNQPYMPEKEQQEQSVRNSIRIKVAGETQPIEISKLLPRLKPLTEKPVDRVRYYVPKDVQAKALNLRANWKSTP